MHKAAHDFVRKALQGVRTANTTCVEFGAYNVNGSARDLFAASATWIGVDLRPGRGVDVVRDAASYDAPESADIVLCTEMLEHATKPQAVLAAALRTLKPGGLLILTAAGPERAPHSNDGRPAIPEGEHYKNIAPDTLQGWLKDAGFVHIDVTHNPSDGDVYAVANASKRGRSADEPTTKE